jgi:hypothetical protein
MSPVDALAMLRPRWQRALWLLAGIAWLPALLGAAVAARLSSLPTAPPPDSAE